MERSANTSWEMTSALICGICLEQYNALERKPKLFPCGHTHCQKCLLQLQGSTTCPQCKRRVPRVNVADMPVNYALLSVVSDRLNEKRDPTRRFWCSQCSSEATTACGDSGHFLRGLRGLRREQTQPQLKKLEEQEEALTRVQDVLRALVAELRLTTDQGDLRQQTLRRSIEKLRECGEPWEVLLQDVEQLLREGDSLDKDLKLLQTPELFNISSQSWEAEGLQLQRDPMLRVALLQLQRKGHLQRKRDAHAAGLLGSQGSSQASQPGFSQDLELAEVDFTSLSQLPGAAPPAPPHPPATLDLFRLSYSEPTGDLKAEKAALLLSRGSEVHVLKGVGCHRDPLWVLQLLRRHSPTLRELELFSVGREQLLQLRHMPRLLQLRVQSCQADLAASPALPPELVEPWRCAALRSLRVRGLPEPTVDSLLGACGGSLQEVQLHELSLRLLLKLLGMPNLRSLDLDGCHEDLAKQLTALKSHADRASAWKGKLERLRLSGVPGGAVDSFLRAHRPTLEEIELSVVNPGVLKELQCMPRLRSLDLDPCEREDNVEVPPGPWRGELSWLRVGYLPRDTVRGLLASHRGSLRELVLWVGTPPPTGQPDNWPDTCADLAALLKESCGGGARRLRSLTLRRCGWVSHSSSACLRQLAALRAALPCCSVTCECCQI